MIQCLVNILFHLRSYDASKFFLKLFLHLDTINGSWNCVIIWHAAKSIDICWVKMTLPF